MIPVSCDDPLQAADYSVCCRRKHKEVNVFPNSEGAVAPALSPLHRALSGDDFSARSVIKAVLPQLRSAARRRAPDIAPDLHDEIISEMWRLVFQRGLDAFIRAQVDDASYLMMVLRNAVEIVRANNRSPGTRSRGRDEHAITKADLHIASDLCEERFMDYEDDLIARIDVDLVLSRMAIPERQAAIYLLEHDSNITDAASATGFTRQTLARKLAATRCAA